MEQLYQMNSSTYNLKPASNGYIFTREDYEAENGWSSTVMIFTDYNDVVKYLTDNPIPYKTNWLEHFAPNKGKNMNETTNNFSADVEVPVIDANDATLAPTLVVSGDGEAAQPEGTAFIAEDAEAV
jgi:hypothetical protein